MNKRIKKQFWLSPKDAEELKRKAELAGLTETAVVRLLIRGYEPREKPDERFYKCDSRPFRREFYPNACRKIEPKDYCCRV